MADEGILELPAAYEHSETDVSDTDVSKADLQRRMDATRDSISHTVTEIKDTVVHQYEAVKDTIHETLDWREQFKKRPVAWSAGAVGGGFLLGYAIAAMAKGGSGRDEPYDYWSVPAAGESSAVPKAPGFDLREPSRRKHDPAPKHEDGPGLLERLQQTAACERLREETAAVGNKFVDELSKTAQEVVVPGIISWIREWLHRVPEFKTGNQMSNDPGTLKK
jgi:hypothetical protein